LNMTEGPIIPETSAPASGPGLASSASRTVRRRCNQGKDLHGRQLRSCSTEVPDMREDQRVPEIVKVRVRYRPTPDMPARESLAAAPVEAGPNGGTYRLQNSSFVVPLAAGDVVRAELAGDGELQLTGLVSASPSILTVVGAPPGAELDLQPV